MSEEIRIYVADLAAYNNGKLHGVWIDATLEPEEIQEQVNTMLAACPEGFAEEWAIHDYEGFGGYSISEYEAFESVHKIACFVEEYPVLGAKLLINFGGDLEDATKAAEEGYAGEYESMADYAEDITEQTTQIPENLAYYIDYESMGRDMELNGDIFTIQTAHDEVHIFYNH